MKTRIVILIATLLITVIPVMADEEASDLVEAFMEMPTKELERKAREGTKRGTAMYCLLLSSMVETSVPNTMGEILKLSESDSTETVMQAIELAASLEEIHSLIDHLSEHCAGRIE